MCRYKSTTFLNQINVLFFFYRETNLKVRQAIPETAELEDDINKLSHFDGNIFNWFITCFLLILEIQEGCFTGNLNGYSYECKVLYINIILIQWKMFICDMWSYIIFSVL